VLAAIAVGGCFSDERGFHIVVHDDHAETVSVDMYLAVDSAAGVEGMIPEGAMKLMKGTVLLLDSDIPPANHELVDGQVVFNILPSDAAAPLALGQIVFIGRGSQGGAVSVGNMGPISLDADGSVAYRIDLQEAASSVEHPSDSNISSGTRVFEWPPDRDASRVKCTDLEFAEDANPGSVIHYFLVPPEDRDCDGRLATANVCPVEDDYLYDPNRPTTSGTVAAFENAKCGVTRQVGTMSNVHDICSLGAPPSCPDAANDDRCLEFTTPMYCAPNKMCEQDECLAQPDICNADPGMKNDWTKGNSGSTFLNCRLAFDQAGNVCPAGMGSEITVDINARIHDAFANFPAASTVQCAGAKLWVPGTAPANIVAFYEDSDPNHRPNLEVESGPGPCSMTLSYGGNAFFDATHGTDVSAYGGVDLTLTDIVNAQVSHVVMPLRVNFIPCGGLTSCELSHDGADDFTSLAQCFPH
jgi:hypothetical protein